MFFLVGRGNVRRPCLTDLPHHMNLAIGNIAQCLQDIVKVSFQESQSRDFIPGSGFFHVLLLVALLGIARSRVAGDDDKLQLAYLTFDPVMNGVVETLLQPIRRIGF